MNQHEWTKLHHHPQLDLGLLHAYYVKHAYPRHSHDYYVITLIERGRQSFTHRGMKHVTLPGGLILINPGEVHTGEAADSMGFEMRSLYPTISTMEAAVFELTGRHHMSPFFKQVRVDHSLLINNISSLHKAIFEGASMLECESRLLWTLAQLIKQHADISFSESRIGNEKSTIQHARDYIDDHFASGVSLKELAGYVGLSPYYFLRVFRAEVGMPPYAYLESVRIGRAQRLIESGKSLTEAAFEAGFSSQSHMTNRFRKIIGATPGQYAAQVRS